MARRTRKFSEDVPFSLTSMMDMMTIILVFMIKNLDAEGQLLTQAENLILPVSTSKVQPKEVALTVVVDNNYVVVDNAKIVPTEDVLKQEDLLVTKVDSVLKERRATEQEHALTKPVTSLCRSTRTSLTMQCIRSWPLVASLATLTLHSPLCRRTEGRNNYG